MKRKIAWILSLIFLVCSLNTYADQNTDQEEKNMDTLFTLNWEYEPVEYEHFTDLGHYMIELKGISVNDVPAGLAYHAKTADSYASNACSGTIKKNNSNQVLMSHSMEVESSQCPRIYHTDIRRKV